MDWESIPEDVLIEIFSRSGRKNWPNVARTCEVVFSFSIIGSKILEEMESHTQIKQDEGPLYERGYGSRGKMELYDGKKKDI
jgi:hypothetical protein